MAVNPIARSYWNLIKASRRTFDSVPDSVKEDVITLAEADVEKGVITPEQFAEFIGKEYETEEKNETI